MREKAEFRTAARARGAAALLRLYPHQYPWGESCALRAVQKVHVPAGGARARYANSLASRGQYRDGLCTPETKSGQFRQVFIHLTGEYYYVRKYECQPGQNRE